MMRAPILAVFGVTVTMLPACVPELETEGGTDGVCVGATWEAPVNTWDVGDPPDEAGCSTGWAVGQTAPDVRMIDQHGDEVSLWQFYGQVVVVDVSTMWCGPCRTLAQEVDETWLHYKDEGMMYLTFLPEDIEGDLVDVEELNLWADTYDITAPVLADVDRVSYTIAPDAVYPRIVVLDRTLTVRNSRVTPAEDAAIRTEVEQHL